MGRRRRRKFSRAFKLEMVRLVIEHGHSVSEVARDLDISENLLRRWKKELAADVSAGVQQFEDENGRRHDPTCEQRRQEALFLKKATRFFIKTPDQNKA